MKWENIYIFISSTFNDMHAERDYLIKRVFPELRIWCNERKLKLIDIDLRWGVSEKDATENKRVVDVCLNNVDKCRPFLLCFLGQRRGWIPGFNDINEGTLAQFPSLSDYLGKHSITELEVIHGLIHPMNDTKSNMRHAFFYCRKPDYLDSISSDSIKQVFQRESDGDLSIQDDFQIFKDSLKDQYEVIDYDSTWNPKKVSLELKNVQGQDLSSGRLDNFSIQGISLANYVLDQLKYAIQEEFPEHFMDLEQMDELEKELNHQDTYLFNACDSYISREQEEASVLQYFTDNSRKPMILMANAGTGKTSMLAHLIQSNQIPENVFYRFIGTSSASSDMERTLYMLMEELSRKGFLPMTDVENERSNILLAFPNLLQKISKNCCILLDAADQWNHLTPSSFFWIPETLPEQVKLLISIKSDSNPEILEKLQKKDYYFHTLDSMTSRQEKTSLIQGYLSQFLKDIDENQIEHILALPGSDNPLYLKIVLNELRIHGSFDTLMEELDKNYGQNPKEAFFMVLNRLEHEVFGEQISSAELVKYILGTIGCSLEGVLLDEYASICKSLIPECKTLAAEDIMDAVYGLIRHLSPYLVIDGNRVNFLYDSFKQAVNEKYQDSYTQFQNILTMLYSRYCYKTGGAKYQVSQTSYLTCYIHHAIECSKNWADSILTDPWFLYSLLTKTNTRKVADYFNLIHEKYEDTEEYSAIAKTLNRISSRLDMGANPLFYELKKQVGLNNSIVDRLCNTASKVMELPFYYPKKEEKTSGLLPDREQKLFSEYTTPFDRPEPFIVDNWVVYIVDDHVLLQNIETEEYEKRVPLRRSVYRSYAFRGYLYVHYFRSDEVPDGDFEIFEIPSFQSVFYKTERPALPGEFTWRTICYGCHGIQYQYAQVHNAEIPELYVYNLNTGEVQIHSTYPADTRKVNSYSSHDISFCNEYLVEVTSLYGKTRIWHVPSSTLLLEDGDQYKFYIACEGDDMWYVSHAKDYRHITCYLYHKEENGTIQLKNKRQFGYDAFLFLSEIGASNGHLFLFFESGDFWVFNQQLEFTGSQKLEFAVTPYTAVELFTCHQLLYTYDSNIMIMSKPELLVYDKHIFLSDLKDSQNITRKKESYTPVVHDGSLILLSNVCRNIQLSNFWEKQSEPYGRYSYHVNNIIHYGYCDYIMGTNRRKEDFIVQMLDLKRLTVGFRFIKPIPEGVTVLEDAYFKDGIACTIFRNQEDVTRKITDQYAENKEEKCSSYTLFYYDVRKDFELIDTWKPDFYETLAAPILFTENTIPYLMFLRAYKDAEHSEVQIYDMMEKKQVFSYSYHHVKKRMGLDGDILYINEHPCIRFADFEAGEFHYLEISPTKGIIDEYVLPTGHIAGYTSSEIYLISNYEHIMEVYSIKEKRIIHTIEFKTHTNSFRAFRNQDDLLVLFTGGACEVYNANTYEFKYRQYLVPGYERAFHCSNSDLVYIGTSTSDFSLLAPGSTNTTL